jgi:DNA-binding MarR family transcriptional regulator
MDQLIELLFKQGLRPLSVFPDSTALEEQLSRSDLSTLMVLLFHGEMTMSDLASELGAPLSTVTSIAKRLERKRMITRKASDKDQRSILVTLTEEGKQLAGKGKETLNELFERVQAALTPEEITQFIGLAIKVGKALQQPVASGKTADVAQQKPRKIEIGD